MFDAPNQSGTYQQAFAAFGVDPMQRRTATAVTSNHGQPAASAQPSGNVVTVDFVNKRVVQQTAFSNVPTTSTSTNSSSELGNTNPSGVAGSDKLPSSAFLPPVDVDPQPGDQKTPRHAPGLGVPFQPGPQGGPQL